MAETGEKVEKSQSYCTSQTPNDYFTICRRWLSHRLGKIIYSFHRMLVICIFNFHAKPKRLPRHSILKPNRGITTKAIRNQRDFAVLFDDQYRIFYVGRKSRNLLA